MNDITNNNYVINVSISIEKKGEHHEEFEPKKNSNGDYSLVISQNEAESIDHIEKAVLKTSFPAIRDAVSNHLSVTKIAFPSKQLIPVLHNIHRGKNSIFSRL